MTLLEMLGFQILGISNLAEFRDFSKDFLVMGN